jgi:putative methyltransferase (TIGR04325 family)
MSPIAGLFRQIKRKIFPPTTQLEGYEHPELVDVVFKKTLAYNAPCEVWPDVVGAATVLDLGGAFGVHYKEAIHHTPDVRWAVVEVPAMVQRAAEVATDRLRFFSSIAEAAAWLGPIDLMHSSGALQYTPGPEKTVAELCGLGAKRMHWRRLVLSADATVRKMQESFLTDNGPGAIDNVQEKRVQYLRTSIPEHVFLEAHAERYRLAERGEDWFRFTLR